MTPYIQIPLIGATVTNSDGKTIGIVESVSFEEGGVFVEVDTEIEDDGDGEPEEDPAKKVTPLRAVGSGKRGK